MSVHAIARPYAKALFMLAQEQNEVKAWSEWLALASVLAQHPLTVDMLSRPVYTKQFRLDFFESITKEVMADLPITQKISTFLFVLSEQNRVVLLPEIAKAFEAIRRLAENSIQVEVTSAKPFSVDEREKLIVALSKRFSSSIELIIKEDPSLMAGAVIRVQDIILDGSVMGKIRQLREALA